MPKKKPKKKSKVPVAKQPVYAINIIEHRYTDVTREATEDRWDADDLAHSVSVEGVCLADKDSSGDLVIDFPIEQGGTYYLVSVTHTDGDSFHHETGLVAYVDLFKTKKEADDLAMWIKKKDEGRNNNSKASFEDRMNLRHNGKDYYIYQWSGYFNRLEYVNVDCVHTISRH